MADSYDEAVKAISGLTHYYPLVKDANDTVGRVNGTNKGATFSSKGATFNGSSYIDLGDNDDFSVATKGAITFALYLTIADWKGKGASEYVHWAGKGEAGKHEYVFRHYVKGGSGEAASRQGRMSFYHFNPAGGLGAGSYYQDSTFPTTERFVVGTCDMKQLQMYVNAVKRDTDPLSGYNVVPKNTTSSLRLGTRDMSTGYLVGTIRRVAIFNKILSQAEITALYAARTLPDTGGSTPPDPPKPPDPSTGDVTVGGKTHKLDGVDVKRESNQLIEYTQKFGTSTGTNDYGTECLVVDQKVVSVKVGAGNMTIPSKGYVLSGHGTAATFLRDNATVGAQALLPGETPNVDPPKPPDPGPDDQYKNYLVPVGTANPTEQLVAKHNLLVLKLHEEGII
jgi:hypothetical protein